MDLSRLPDNTEPSEDSIVSLRKHYRTILDKPEDYLRARRAARLTGLPEPVAFRNLDRAERMASEPDWQAFAATAPQTSGMLQDVDLFRLAYDDTPALGGLEQSIKALGAGAAQATLGIAEAIWRTPDAMRRMTQAPEKALPDMPLGIGPAFGLRAAEEVLGLLSRATNPVADRIAETQRMLAEDAQTFGNAFQRISAKGQQADAALVRALSGDLGPLFDIATDLEAWSGFIGQAAPSIYTAYKSGGAIPFIAWLEAMQTASDAADFERRTGQKINPEDFAMAAGQTAAINSLLERYGLDRVIGARGNGIAGIFKAIVSEGGTEGLQEFNSNLSQFLTYDPEQNLGEGVLGSVMGGAGSGGVMSSAIAVGEVASRAVEKRVQHAQAEEVARQFADIGAAAEQSKLLNRSPELFRKVIDQAVKEGVDAVYIEARALSEALSQSKLQLPETTAQIAEAAEAGGDVAVPMGEFVQMLANPDLRSLAEIARLDPFAPNAAEARLWQEQYGEQIQQEIGEAIQGRTSQQEQSAGQQAVYDNLLSQLQAANRFSKPVNRVYATLQRDFFSTMAQRAGMGVQEFAAAYPLRIVAETVDGKGQRYDQEGGANNEALVKTRASVAALPGLVPLQRSSVNKATITQSDNAFNQAEDGRRASFNPETGTMALLQAADLSSFLHESGHFWLEVLADLAARDNAPEQIRADMQQVLDWFGIQSGSPIDALDLKMGADLRDMAQRFGITPRALVESWKAKPPTRGEQGAWWKKANGIPEIALYVVENPEAKVIEDGRGGLATWRAMSFEQRRQYHEQFARGAEAYFFEGKAPSLQLQGIFSRFRAWLLSIYKSLTALDVQLNDEVRGVFDRLLATDDQLDEAAAVRNMQPLFTTKPDVMTEMEWLQYQAIGEEARETAAGQYQARRLKDLAARQSKDGRQAYKAIMDQVRAEVLLRPVYAVQEYLKRGVLPDGSQAGDPVKLAIPVMQTLYGDGPDALWRRLPLGHNGMATSGEKGVHPDIVAEQFGFASGDALIRAIVESPKLSEVVKAEAAQRFAEQYGDAYSAEGIKQAAEDALTSESREQQLVAELNALQRTTGKAQMLVKAARDYATRAVGNMPVKRARNTRQHTAAESRAAKTAERAYIAGDMTKAQQAKREQVLNHQLARASASAREEIQAAIVRTRKYFKPDSSVAKLHDMDMVNAARAILAAHGLGVADKPAASYLEAIRKNDADSWAEIEPLVQDALTNPKDYRAMSMDQFRGMIEGVETLWHLSRRTRQIEIDGQLRERAEIVSMLSLRLQDIGQPYENLGLDKAITPWQDTKFGLLGIRASLRRVESWVSAMDGNNPDGVFRKFIWNPVRESINEYRAAKQQVLSRYLELAKGVRMPKGRIEASELGYTFNSKAELLHAILHTGNESNMSKLMRGRNWGQYRADGTVDSSAWNRFIYRAAREGIITKADYDFVQGVWDLLESTKPAAQKAHRDMYGMYFNEVEARPVVTPFGTYRGGYVPAVTDPRIVTDAAVHQEADNLMGDAVFMFPTTGRGFTKGRVEAYAKPLLLDLGYLPAHIDKVLRFSHVEPHIKDVARIVKTSSAFGKAMDAFDPTIRTDLLIPWLQRSAAQRVETPSKGRAGRAADQFFRALRKRVGLNIMTANVLNTLQQVTGLSSALLKVKPRYMRNAVWQYLRQPTDMTELVNEKSVFMSQRVTSQVMEVQQHIDDLLTNPTKYEQAKAFAEKHGYFMQAGFQNVVDIMTWSAAYEQSVEGGASETDAVRAADSAVRETQGSFSPEDISRFEAGSPFMRLFTMFYSYFNGVANAVGTEFVVTAREMGLMRGAGRMFYVYLVGLMIPAVIGDLVIRAGAVDWDDDDDDDVDLWDALSIFISAQGRFVAAMVPGVGPATISAINAFNNKWYDDRISTSPAVSAIESAVRAPNSVYKAIAEEGSSKRAVRDTLTAVGLLSGLPVAPLAKPIGYLADVEEGNIEPEGALDMARGLITGRAAAN